MPLDWGLGTIKRIKFDYTKPVKPVNWEIDPRDSCTKAISLLTLESVIPYHCSTWSLVGQPDTKVVIMDYEIQSGYIVLT